MKLRSFLQQVKKKWRSFIEAPPALDTTWKLKSMDMYVRVVDNVGNRVYYTLLPLSSSTTGLNRSVFYEIYEEVEEVPPWPGF